MNVSRCRDKGTLIMKNHKLKKYFLGINLSCVLTASNLQKNNFWLVTAVNPGALTVYAPVAYLCIILRFINSLKPFMHSHVCRCTLDF